jgi:Tol biopolymer transport system component
MKREIEWRIVALTPIAVIGAMWIFGCGSTSSAPPSNPVPSVASLSPASVVAGGSGFTLTVAGSGFVSGSTVRWNGSDRPTTFASSTQLTAAIAASDIASSVTIQITVFNPVPSDGVSNLALFPIVSPPPALTSLSPLSVMAGHAPFDLTFNGSGFFPGSFVQWNGSARPTTFASSTQLTAAISASDVSSPGTAQVRVVNSTQDASSPLAFTINTLTSNPTPAVASLSPATAPAGWPGFPLTASGSDFVASTILQWNGLSQPTTALSSTRLVAGIPLSDLASVATAQVGVFTPSPGGGVSNTLSFTTFSVPTGTLGVIDRSSIATDLTETDKNSYSPAISGNGRYVAFASYATNLVPGDTNGFTDIFLRDTCIGAPVGCTPSTTRVSVGSNGDQANGFSFSPTISADGRNIAFTSDATNLVPGDTNGFTDLFVRDTCVGAPVGCTPSTTRVSLDSQGNQFHLASLSPAISASGRYVAFVLGFISFYYDVVADAFLRDTCAGAPAGCTPSTVPLSVDTNGLLSGQPNGPVAISAHGRYVTFASDAANLVANDTNKQRDVFVRDTCVGAPASCTPSTVRVSVSSQGAQSSGFADAPAISADGRFVAFSSDASNLAPGDTNNNTDIFLARTGFNPASSAAGVSASAPAKPTTGAAALKRDSTALTVSSRPVVRSSGFHSDRGRGFGRTLLDLP